MENRGNWLLYQETVRRLTEKSIREEYLENVQHRSRQYHVDHLLSIREGFEQDVPPDLVAHICNLRVVHARDNLRKGQKSSLTFSELLEEITERDSYF